MIPFNIIAKEIDIDFVYEIQGIHCIYLVPQFLCSVSRSCLLLYATLLLLFCFFLIFDVI